MKSSLNWLGEYLKDLVQYYTINNRKIISYLEGIESIADFCCGTGRGTIRIAETFPEAEVYGFDIMPKFIEKARRKGSRVHFHVRDIYTMDYEYFDAITFYNASGCLADRVIKYGIEVGARIIVGKSGCNNFNWLIERYISYMNKRVGENFIIPKDFNLQDDYLKGSRRVHDLNRLMKLMESGYKVEYDEENHIIIAQRE